MFIKIDQFNPRANVARGFEYTIINTDNIVKYTQFVNPHTRVLTCVIHTNGGDEFQVSGEDPIIDVINSLVGKA